MKRDQRGEIINFMRVHDKIPRDQKNDPCFARLSNNRIGIDEPPHEEGEGPSIREVFSDDEIVAMVNRFLYNMEYGRSWHRKWEREKSEKTAPLKRKVREMFNVGWNRATPDQLRAAQAALKDEDSSLPTGS